MKSLFITFFISFILALNFSCSRFRSGKYAPVFKGDTWEKIAKEFHISVDDLKSANWNVTLKEGRWIFIPLKAGLLGGDHFNRPLFSSFDGHEDGHKKSSKSGPYKRKKRKYDLSLYWPVPSSKVISSRFGRRYGRPHRGVDIPAVKGVHIVSALDGEVIYSGNGLKGYGNLTIVKHKNNFVTVYAHAKKNLTRRGQKVLQGQPIAQIGSTGRSTGPHLHFELRKNNNAIDPLPYLRRF